MTKEERKLKKQFQKLSHKDRIHYALTLVRLNNYVPLWLWEALNKKDINYLKEIGLITSDYIFF